MKRVVLCLLLAGVVALGAVGFLRWYLARRDTGPDPVLAVGVEVASTADAKQERTILSVAGAVHGLGDGPAEVAIDYPLDGSIFPPEMVPPTFLWHDDHEQADRWLIDIALTDGQGHIYVLAKGGPPPPGREDSRCFGATNEPYEPTAYQASAKSWTPSEDVWAAIQAGSVSQGAKVTIFGFDSRDSAVVLSRGRMTLTTSTDPIDGVIFYRDVPLMPAENEKGVIKPLSQSSLPLITWRLKDISRPDSRAVLTDMPTCANCHSFSADGQMLAMDIDGPGGDKGTYAISPIAANMIIPPEEIMTWSDFPEKIEGHNTFGFLSQISPDGQYVVSTVNESVYVVNFTDYRFLQVFYPTRGILAYYSRRTGEIAALPGADDPDYVHCDPVWTPKGDWIVFARARARDPRVEKMASYANDPVELQIQYDLYRIPFKDGQGGAPEPIEGASSNGMSNTFPKVSPDGKWIVFVKCRNGLLMRPDSELWIVPLAGGEARKMTCNTPLMNSWHSFSPNGRWMVFSSKVNTPYTQMFLTHIDTNGNDSPPILIPNATASNRAVNIPEFVNINYDDLVSITVPSVEYHRHVLRGSQLYVKGLFEEAIVEYEKALAEDPTSGVINNNLGSCLASLGRLDEAIECYEQCLRTDPRDVEALVNLAKVLTKQEKIDQAIELYRQAAEYQPQLVRGPLNVAVLLTQQGRMAAAIRWWEKVLAIDPDHGPALVGLGEALAEQGELDQAIEQYRKALVIDPQDVYLLNLLGIAVSRQGQIDEAIELFTRAVEIDPDDPVSRHNLNFARASQGENVDRP